MIRRHQEEKVPGPRQKTYGERRLLAAVLRRAVKDILSCGGDGSNPNRRLADEAWCWIHDEGADYQLTSFVNLCQELGLRPNRVRQAISDLKTQQADVATDALRALP